MSNQLTRSIYDKSVARIKAQYAHQPELRDLILGHFTEVTELYEPGSTTSRAPVAAAPDQAQLDHAAQVRQVVLNTGVTRKEAERRIAEADGTAPKTFEDLEGSEKIEMERFILGDNYKNYPGAVIEPDDRTPQQIFEALQADFAVEQAHREVVRIDPAKVDANREAASVARAQAVKDDNARKALRLSGVPREEWPARLQADTPEQANTVDVVAGLRAAGLTDESVPGYRKLS